MYEEPSTRNTWSPAFRGRDGGVSGGRVAVSCMPPMWAGEPAMATGPTPRVVVPGLTGGPSNHRPCDDAWRCHLGPTGSTGLPGQAGATTMESSLGRLERESFLRRKPQPLRPLEQEAQRGAAHGPEPGERSDDPGERHQY